MGFCYPGKKLVCENCGAAEGTTRKRRCPSGYCYPAALCKKCWADKTIRAKFNAFHIEHKCAEKMQESRNKKDREVTLMDSGIFLRCAALNTNDGRVHVIFRQHYREIGKYMAKETYAAIGLGEIATIDDFEKIEGKPLEDAPTEFYPAKGVC